MAERGKDQTCLREDFLLNVLDIGGRDAEAVQQALVVVLFVHGVERRRGRHGGGLGSNFEQKIGQSNSSEEMHQASCKPGWVN